MKKRKIKLFASVASLAMVAAVMGVGVWAATNQAVSVNSTVSFTSTSIDATIKLGVQGDYITQAQGATTNYLNATPQTLATFTKDQLAQLQSDNLQVTYAGDDDGMAIDGNKITYTFNIAPTTTSDTVHFNVTAATPTAATQGYTYTVQIFEGAEGEEVLEGNQTATGAAGTTFRVVYTLDLANDGKATAADTFSIKLNDIRINLANSAENLTKAEGIVAGS